MSDNKEKKKPASGKPDSGKPDSGPITFTYRFSFPDDTRKTIAIQLDRKTLNLILPSQSTYPDWTRLRFEQCPNCPLTEEKHPFCPAAVGLIDLIGEFQKLDSFQEAKVEVLTETRHYAKETSVQKGVSSLIGIYMATCGCPILEKLKPMVRYHLPFATPEETMYRALSMYLLAQFLAKRRGKTPDWSLKNLEALYEEVRKVNKSFVQRIMGASQKDVGVNAVVILDCLAEHTKFSLNRNLLAELEKIFQVYFN